MAKQLNVNLRVNADVGQAKKAMQDLQSTLSNLSAKASANSNFVNTNNLRQASQAAQELQKHLQAATDVNTGKLNLSQFSNSLKNSNKTLKNYKAQLESIGAEGQSAFLKVSYAVASAEAPVRRVNGALKEMSTVLANTARWQISSSILHGFMGAVQTAYGYVQDLNRSLNDIRIVTGYSTDQMAEFAERANRAAQALSATTTEYTNASLIFYQQGLSDDEVEARTNTTIKIAHAAGESATQVSSYMTAIWNNFAEGADNLEYYGDVITKLGAATAASSAEIAGGLEKFAAVADTVGLSYEYAAAAVTTIVDKTRQSEDVVGTSLKTIFARLEGLQLGDTLEDGTDLNKYSKALLTVGVNIKDANGELKDMDTILDELGAKWNTLNKDEQIALAQTVGGMRQYNQFISLMDNFESFQENISMARGSAGALQEQADIYAESWEGAEKRVKAAAQNIYQSLLDDKFFIGMNNVFVDILKSIGGITKGLGGMQGIIGILGAFISQKLAIEAPVALNRIKDTLQIVSGKAKEVAEVERQTAIGNLQTAKVDTRNEMRQSGVTGGFYDTGSYINATEANTYKLLSDAQNEYYQKKDKYSSEERAQAEAVIQGLKDEAYYLTTLTKSYDSLCEKARNYSNTLKEKSTNQQVYADQQLLMVEASGQKQMSNSILQESFGFTEDSTLGLEQVKEKIKEVINATKELGFETARAKELIQNIDKQTTLEGIKTALNDFKQTSEGDWNAFEKNFTESLTNIGLKEPEIKKMIDYYKQIAEKGQGVINGNEKLGKSFEGLNNPVITTSEMVTTLSSSLMTLSSVISSIKSLTDVFSNKDATVLEKITALVGALTSVMFAYNSMSKIGAKLKEYDVQQTAKAAAAKLIEARAEKAETEATKQNTKANIANAGSEKLKGDEALITSGKKTVEDGSEGGGHVLGGLKNLIGGEGGIGPALAAIAGFVAVAATLAAITKAYNDSRPDAVFKKVSEAAKEAAEAYDEVKSKQEELTNTLNNYDSAVKGLEDLTEGTVEFQQQIIKANDSALELISNFTELQGHYSVNSDGLIEFDDQAKDIIAQSQAAQIRQAQFENLSAQTIQGRAAIDNKRYQIAKSDDSTTTQAASIALGAAAGAALGTAIPVVGNIVGAIGGAIIGGLATNLAATVVQGELDDEQVKILKEIQRQFDESNGSVLSNVQELRKSLYNQGYSKELVDSLLADTNALQDLCTEVQANTAAITAQNKILLGDYLEDNNATYANSDRQQIYTNILAEAPTMQNVDTSYWDSQ